MDALADGSLGAGSSPSRLVVTAISSPLSTTSTGLRRDGQPDLDPQTLLLLDGAVLRLFPGRVIPELQNPAGMDDGLGQGQGGRNGAVANTRFPLPRRTGYCHRLSRSTKFRRSRDCRRLRLPMT